MNTLPNILTAALGHADPSFTRLLWCRIHLVPVPYSLHLWAWLVHPALPLWSTLYLVSRGNLFAAHIPNSLFRKPIKDAGQHTGAKGGLSPLLWLVDRGGAWCNFRET